VLTRSLTYSHTSLLVLSQSLGYALDKRVKERFLELSLACKSVICCRVSPMQKADVVRLVKEKVKNSITLAIGDGANDVSMIQAAHVGVGISGKEGLQATLASDYAIGQFRFLVKLLLVHGTWNYNRLALLVLFSFYKNICLYIIEFWFAFWNGFSGQPLFERWTIGLYNVLFTGLAPFSLGLFNQDISARLRLSRPSLYRPSQENKGFNSWVFWQWVGLSIFHSLVLFFATYFFLSHEVAFDSGKVFGLWYVGNTVYTAVVVTVNLKAGFESDYWTWVRIGRNLMVALLFMKLAIECDVHVFSSSLYMCPSGAALSCGSSSSSSTHTSGQHSHWQWRWWAKTSSCSLPQHSMHSLSSLPSSATCPNSSGEREWHNFGLLNLLFKLQS